MPISIIFSYIMAVGFIGGANGKKPKPAASHG